MLYQNDTLKPVSLIPLIQKYITGKGLLRQDKFQQITVVKKFSPVGQTFNSKAVGRGRCVLRFLRH